MQENKRVKRLSLVSTEEVSHGFGLRTENLETPTQHGLQGGSRRSELQTFVFFFWKAVFLDGMH